MHVASTTDRPLAPKPQGEIAWLRSSHFDVLLISAPIALQVLALVVFLTGQVEPLTIFLCYSLMLDAPHIAATHAKLFVARRQRPWLTRLWLQSFAAYFLGPLALIAGAISGTTNAFKLFYGMVLCWSAFHAVRQSYGIYVTYQLRLGEETTGRANPVSYYLFHGALLISATYFLLFSSLPRWIFPNLQLLSPLQQAPLTLTVVACLALLLGHETWQLVRHQGRSLPRFLLVATLTIFPAALYLSGSHSLLPPLLLAPLFTIQHTVQYAAFTYHSLAPRSELAPALQTRLPGSSLPVYLGCIFGVGILVRLLEWSTTKVNPFFPKLVGNVELFSSLDTQSLWLSVLLGYTLQHHILDQYLWKKTELSSLGS